MNKNQLEFEIPLRLDVNKHLWEEKNDAYWIESIDLPNKKWTWTLKHPLRKINRSLDWVVWVVCPVIKESPHFISNVCIFDFIVILWPILLGKCAKKNQTPLNCHISLSNSSLCYFVGKKNSKPFLLILPIRIENIRAVSLSMALSHSLAPFVSLFKTVIFITSQQSRACLHFGPISLHVFISSNLCDPISNIQMTWRRKQQKEENDKNSS